MYAIIETGGIQVKVAPGDIVTLPRISRDKEGKISFSNVLFFSDGEKIEVGKPCLKNVKVEGELVRDFKGKKIIFFEYKRRKKYERRIGFRRELSDVKITKISEG